MIGDRIKNRRKELGLSAEDVALKIGVSPATIYRYESGDIGSPGSNKIMNLAKSLNTHPAYLMGWDEDPDGDYERDSPAPEGTGEEFGPEQLQLAGIFARLPEQEREELLLLAKYKLSKRDESATLLLSESSGE